MFLSNCAPDPWTAPCCSPYWDLGCPRETAFLSPGRAPAHPCSHSAGAGGHRWRVLSLGLADHTGCDWQAFPGWRRHLKVLTGRSVSSGPSMTI